MAIRPVNSIHCPDMGSKLQKLALGLVVILILGYLAYMAYRAGGIASLMDKIWHGALR